ncbi:MAG: 4Fe-4S binding protein [Spirochaetaceae bacterium]|nr:4Fe-4S binding protein [Spirochaetaceae bacterium]
MIRKIIEIDARKCDGCGLCVSACHEGAIGIEGGRAKLLREDFCDGLGNCLPACPAGAIVFTEREAAPFTPQAVEKTARASPAPQSELRHWPLQIRLVPVTAPYFENADLVIAADCTAYAYANFHADFMRDKITLIGCPKLDAGDYAEKLAAILRANSIKSAGVIRMEVPCCAGMAAALSAALTASGKTLPRRDVVISCDGGIARR